MPRPLPLPIERYLAAENTGDLDSLSEIFALARGEIESLEVRA